MVKFYHLHLPWPLLDLAREFSICLMREHWAGNMNIGVNMRLSGEIFPTEMSPAASVNVPTKTWPLLRDRICQSAGCPDPDSLS